MYERLTVKGKKPTFVTLIITQIVSGIWHGLFAGYALFFVSVAFAIQASKVLFRWAAFVSPTRVRAAFASSVEEAGGARRFVIQAFDLLVRLSDPGSLLLTAHSLTGFFVSQRQVCHPGLQDVPG